MLICPKCRTTYSSSLVGVCYRDGETLVRHDALVAPPADPLRGRVVAGKYRVGERVGQGGMGTVYEALQIGLNRRVAVKILKRELSFDPDTVARFQREANALSLLVHPNTVRVYDFGQTEDGLLFLVMELLEGELVTAKLNREGVMDALEAVRVTQQILRSLAEAHEHGIVHRDLKPDNILVTKPRGQVEQMVKVLDFGIAKIATAEKPLDQFETQAGTVFGTPRYMSPEQAQGATLDGRSDLYSVGTLLYLMLTGRAPFVDDDAVVIMAKHIRETPVSPRVAAPHLPIPKLLDDVVMRSLEKDPAARFANAGEFEAALEACVPEILASAKRARRPRWQQPAVFAVACLALCGTALGLWLGHTAWPDENAQVVASPLSTSPGVKAAAAPAWVVTEHDAQAMEAESLAEEEVLAPGPGPANVAIRSEPNGATVYRDGERLGETPLNLLVNPEQDLVRVELRMSGYQPLLAELTARDGERLLKLDKTAPEVVLPSAPRTVLRDVSRTKPKPVGEASPASVVKPASEATDAAKQSAQGPADTPTRTRYERFE